MSFTLIKDHSLFQTLAIRSIMPLASGNRGVWLRDSLPAGLCSTDAATGQGAVDLRLVEAEHLLGLPTNCFVAAALGRRIQPLSLMNYFF